jgi:phospholipase D1/2
MTRPIEKRQHDKTDLKMKIIKPGFNCWRLVSATRAACLIDGAAYFSALQQALVQACRSVIIIGWDIDSRIRLVRGDTENNIKEQLGDLLNRVLENRPELEIRILIWDYTFVKIMERELWLSYKLNWKSHPRLCFRSDRSHPLGASHHQKIVVIDDQLAFLGGIDLSKWRWDTPAHQADHPDRVDPQGNPYSPYHDVQMMVEGPVAAALGDLARERWYRATGAMLTAPPKKLPSAWPADICPDFENTPLAISRTEPEYEQHPEIREIERLYLDAVQNAQHCIYIENQYTTSHGVGQALERRLGEPDGPEVILVTHRQSGDWLAQNTMDVLRHRWLSRLQAADRYHRFRVVYPHLPGYRQQSLTVHAKIMVIDDDFLTIGSANLCNRSMGLDTECNLALASEGISDRQQNITRFRNRLLAEHTGLTVEGFTALTESQASLCRILDDQRYHQRSLRPLAHQVPEWQNQQLPPSSIIDPETTVDSPRFRDQLIAPEHTRSATWISLRFISMILLLLCMAAAWRWTPLNQIIDLDRLLTLLTNRQEVYWLGPVMITGFCLGGCLGIPVTLMVTLMALVFPPWQAFLFSYGSTLVSAAMGFGLGKRLGQTFIEQYAGKRIRDISLKIARQGVFFLAFLRLVPIAPFTIINTVGGASHVRFRDFMLGTMIGSIPGTFAVTFFVDQLVVAAQDPRPRHFIIASLIGLFLIVIAWLFKHWLGKKVEKGKQKDLK